MIFTDDLVFLHPPKTAGMSTTNYLLNVLPGPIYLSQPIHEQGMPDKVVQVPGKRHETLAEAREILARCGRDLNQVPIILSTLRNPYDLEVSRWAYLRQRYPWERGPEQDLACDTTFEEFALLNQQRGGSWATDAFAYLGVNTISGNPGGRPYPNELKDFFTVDGQIPRNLRVIRFESIVSDLRHALQSLGHAGQGDFPWVNRSKRDSYPSYYTPAAEAAVFSRYRWAFDEGFYPRLDLTQHAWSSSRDTARPHAAPFPPEWSSQAWD